MLMMASPSGCILPRQRQCSCPRHHLAPCLAVYRHLVAAHCAIPSNTQHARWGQQRSANTEKLFGEKGAADAEGEGHHASTSPLRPWPLAALQALPPPMEANTTVADSIVEEADRDPIRWPRATSSGSAVIGAAGRCGTTTSCCRTTSGLAGSDGTPLEPPRARLATAIHVVHSVSHRWRSCNEYVLEGSAPALPETQRLFRKLISLGIKPVFLTGRTEDQRSITVANLRRQGYAGWEKLLLKPVGFKANAIAYKSGERQKLEDAGYVIVGNIGDQWSDILGAPEGARTFKLPDPLYYIG